MTILNRMKFATNIKFYVNFYHILHNSWTPSQNHLCRIFVNCQENTKNANFSQKMSICIQGDINLTAIVIMTCHDHMRVMDDYVIMIMINKCQLIVNNHICVT